MKDILSCAKQGEKILIGMVHCQPLPGSYRYDGDPSKIIDRAMADALALQAAGFDAILVENSCDAPISATISKSQVAMLSVVASKLRERIQIPIGIEAVFNDYDAALSVAVAVRAQFVRIPIYVDTVVAAGGIMHPCSREALLLRKSLDANDIKIFADVHSKSTRMLVSDIALEESIGWAVGRGADAVIVSGSATGCVTSMDSLVAARQASKVPVFVGSGVNRENCAEQLQIADGVIIGSSLKKDGNLLNPIDPDCAAAFVKTVRG